MAFLLIFRGELEPGVTRQQAAAVLGKKLGKTAEFVEERLFVGKPVKIRSVDSMEEAQRYVEIFRAAGATLDISRRKPDASATADTSATPDAKRRTGGGRRFALIAVTAVVVALIGGAGWYTMPVWMNSTVSETRARASNALATRNVVGLGHIDVERGMQLQARLFGAPDPGALLSADDNLWDSFVAAGIDPLGQIDEVIVALYADDAGDEPSSHWAIVVNGRLTADHVRDWIANRYGIERFDSETATVYFSWLDERTCEPVSMKAVRVGTGHVLFTEADHVDALWQRLEAKAPAEVAIDDWLDLTGEQLVTVGVMNPAGMGHAAGGMIGMMLAAAGQAALPAEGLYFGVAPTLAPPGVMLKGAVTSNDPAFLGQAHTAASAWLDETKAGLADNPDVLELIERISFSLEARSFTAGIRLDSNVGEEIETLVGGIMQRSFGISSMGGAAGPVEEQIDENPLQFRNTVAEQLPSFDSFGDTYSQPQWQEGPFTIGIAGLALDDNGAPALTIRGEGRGMPNLGTRAKLVRLRVNEVVDSEGESLLPLRVCGTQGAREWNESGPVTQGAYYHDNEVTYYPGVTFEKTFTLAAGSSAAEVAAIRGDIEFQLPVEVRSIRVDMPVEGKVVESANLRLVFKAGSPHSLAYQLSGNKNRLLDVRALNAAGAVLKSGSSMWSDGWFGGGEDVSIDIHGTIAAVELIVADRLETLTYAFELPSAYPPFDTNFGHPFAPFEPASASALEDAMQLTAPEVTFDWNPPVASATAGPAFLAMQRLEVSGFMGLVTRFELYVPSGMPLAGHLNGSSVFVDAARLADGTAVPVMLSGTVGLQTDGGYWNNDVFVPDPERPWLKGDLDIQMADYDSATPVTLEGRLLFRAPVHTISSTIPAMPGSRLARDGVELVVSAWQQHGIEIDILQGAERIVSIEALDADGQPAGRAMRISGSGDSREARIVNLVAQPDTLRVLLATESAELEVPFTVTVVTEESTAGL